MSQQFPEEDKEKRRFRVRERWRLFWHCEPLLRTCRMQPPVASRLGVSFAAETTAHFVALDRPSVRSHVPGTRRDRAQAEEAGNKKAKP
jgi:hypothetical protein